MQGRTVITVSTGKIPRTSTEHSIVSQSKLPSVEHWKFSSAGLATRSLSVAHVGVTVAGGGVGEGAREGEGEKEIKHRWAAKGTL